MITKDSSNCDVMCWVFWDATIFCDNFARWLQKIVATVMWCVGFLGCYYLLWQLCKMITKDSSNCDVMCWFSGMRLSFVTTLQDDSTDSINCRRRQLTSFLERISISDICPKISTWILGWHFHELSEMEIRSKNEMSCRRLSNCDVMCWFSGMLLSFVTTLQDDIMLQTCYKDSI
jgi:hypothetical protein